jgi:hypothetical protein
MCFIAGQNQLYSRLPEETTDSCLIPGAAAWIEVMSTSDPMTMMYNNQKAENFCRRLHIGTLCSIEFLAMPLISRGLRHTHSES